ncbi:transcriptional regulator, ArsR family [Coriobacterium glomerans PW2]|uniref:Transcriptional regulator, ArsR family n=1 Tax=Coriobacterium glomerans (strain ATCC 49209 / DSM 20642 / JCM 10262 / PW2) TaxID=700015 RepID=F2NBL2_CORGP|nr:metalloregulator ArsR/SmtB family transcription factor [Coriobacterium glomerans]AEB06748.1 transcriptional regulator, ArsR family [Coriobacterium glomerans PW2]
MSRIDRYGYSDRSSATPSILSSVSRDVQNGLVSSTCLPDEEHLVDLADLFKVFSDATRIKILFTLLETARCVADIAEATGASQSAVSHQLRILKQAHLVTFKRCGRSIEYSLADDHVYTMLLQGMNHICE